MTVVLNGGETREFAGTTPGFAIPTGEAGITAMPVALRAAHASGKWIRSSRGWRGATEGSSWPG
ncbi:MAG: hypothetical protein U0232_25395 [Thermomicrobiales bacterium]